MEHVFVVLAGHATEVVVGLVVERGIECAVKRVFVCQAYRVLEIFVEGMVECVVGYAFEVVV